MPADQIVGPDRGVEIALRRPGNPALAVGVDGQRQQLLAVIRPPPADRAVAMRRYDQASITGNVYSPCNRRDRFLPKLFGLAIDAPQVPVRAQDKGGSVR